MVTYTLKRKVLEDDPVSHFLNAKCMLTWVRIKSKPPDFLAVLGRQTLGIRP